MIIKETLGNIYAKAVKEKHVERVYLRSDDLLKRIQRVKTDHGNEIGIRLKEEKKLEDGDILYEDENNMIIISVLPEDVLVICPATLKEMGEIAHQIGNRHLPAQFEGNEMIVQYDHLVEQLANELNIPCKREKRKIKQPFRYVGHHHHD